MSPPPHIYIYILYNNIINEMHLRHMACYGGSLSLFWEGMNYRSCGGGIRIVFGSNL
ncbi:hypothetical protein Hanom_Chr07g00595541 [Helianthus anomalus]